MAKIGIVYATGSTMIQRIIVPGREDQLVPSLAGEGETLLIADEMPTRGGMVDPANHAHVRAAVREATGVDPPEIVCAVIDGESKVVEAMIMADPVLVQYPSKQVVEVYSQQIAVGCTYDPATGLFSIPAHVIPGYVDKATDEEVPPQVVPEKIIFKPKHLR